MPPRPGASLCIQRDHIEGARAAEARLAELDAQGSTPYQFDPSLVLGHAVDPDEAVELHGHQRPVEEPGVDVAVELLHPLEEGLCLEGSVPHQGLHDGRLHQSVVHVPTYTIVMGGFSRSLNLLSVRWYHFSISDVMDGTVAAMASSKSAKVTTSESGSLRRLFIPASRVTDSISAPEYPSIFLTRSSRLTPSSRGIFSVMT